MKKKLKRMLAITAVATLAIGASGCAQYSAQKWTPDGFNYTLQRDRETGDMSDYFGMSWNLKP